MSTDPPRTESDGSAREGDDALLREVYAELRELASAQLRRERAGHTLQTTALVHEAWLRLERRIELSSEDRPQFLALAAQSIRRILVDHARRRAADKRGGARARVDLESAPELGAEEPPDYLALDEALEKLARLSERQARVVELRFFAGLEVDEVARALGVSPRTVAGDWALARAFLHAELSAGGAA